MNPTVEAWIVIEKLGALVATPGVNEDVQRIANEQIKKLLEDVITPGLAKFAAKASGVVLI